jgi:hypothetical protein
MKKKLKPKIRRIRVSRKKTNLITGAFNAGLRSITAVNNADGVELDKEINQKWAHWFLAKKIKRVAWKSYCSAAQRFKSGFCQKAYKKRPQLLLLPTEKKVAVILSVINEGRTISQILDQLQRLPLEEIIVVVNGSKDGTFTILRNHPTKPIIIHYESALGYDIGRAIGAKASQADILVFIDGDMIIRSEQILPYVHAVELGADIALNDLTPYMPGFNRRDSISIIKEFLNRSLGRADLKANSLTAVPHALSRKACEVIGYSSFAIPPMAQVIAIQQGLKVIAPYGVNVFQKNKIKALNTGVGNVVEQMIIGDNLEALYTAMKLQGERLRMPDMLRQRQMIGGIPYAAN